MKQKNYLKNAFTKLAAIIALSLFESISSFPVYGISQEETGTTKSFADWCFQKENLLKELINLMELSLSDNKIDNITPISFLKNITILNLCQNHIIDIQPLAFLTNLTILNLCFNKISDIAPLSSLTNLNILTLTSNHISEITPLSSLTQLKLLVIKENPLTNQICPVKPGYICVF
ncbi:leucine-rich repeat domain-containing protein [Limnofasciculus baicalensis]|uniref:leucine-rich repeat domain-containing protein n=1 Tax=Limnofasciculus baicalensis TaxID=3064906 RepID=UPI0020A7F7FC|nr:leucine-rich repeat domain-containing protein [Limnofasciculus baicalensis]